MRSSGQPSKKPPSPRQEAAIKGVSPEQPPIMPEKSEAPAPATAVAKPEGGLFSKNLLLVPFGTAAGGTSLPRADQEARGTFRQSPRA